MRQTGRVNSAVQKASVPALLLQSICQMLANATGCNTFLREQYNFIFQHNIDKFICKGVQLYKLQNIRILRCIVQLIGSFQQFLQLICIADQKDLCSGLLLQKVVFLLCAGILRQLCTLAAAGIARGPETVSCSK